MIDLDALQAMVGEEVERLWPGEDIYAAAMSLAEECGEVNRCVVKRKHKSRGTTEEWTRQLRIETAQVVGVCLDIARREGFSLADALADCVVALQTMDKDHHAISPCGCPFRTEESGTRHQDHYPGCEYA